MSRVLAVILACGLSSIVSALQLPQLPYASYAANMSVVKLIDGVTVETIVGSVEASLNAKVVCFPEQWGEPQGNASTATFTATLMNYSSGSRTSRTVSLRSDVERCAVGKLSGNMPPGGDSLLAPAATMTVSGVRNETLDGTPVTVYSLSESTTGMSQQWIVSASSPHVPISLTTLSTGSQVKTTFANYRAIDAMDQECAAEHFRCDTVQCIARPGASVAALQSAIAWVCGVEDCSPIQAGGPRFYPSTPTAHASWAFEQYYLAHAAQGPPACNFGGAGQLVTCDNLPSHCAVVPGASDAALQHVLDWICGPTGIQNCAPIMPGGAHYLPNTTKNHADWAFNVYFQAYRCIPGWDACDFNGTAHVVAN